MLTKRQRQILYKADTDGYISDQMEKECYGIHFCPDWDYMAICNDSPERDGCCCTIKPKMAGYKSDW